MSLNTISNGETDTVLISQSVCTAPTGYASMFCYVQMETLYATCIKRFSLGGTLVKFSCHSYSVTPFAFI